MQEQFVRTGILLGDAAMERLAGARVAIFGIGGVGSYVCEALVRSGIGKFELVDSDRISVSNLNRQIHATYATVGGLKTEVMRERMLQINPQAEIRTRNCFFLPENAAEFDFGSYDYVVDAVDTVTAKLRIILSCREKQVPVISAMGTGNKLDPSRLRITDIYETEMDPLSRVMRKELRKRGIDHLKVIFSDEEPMKPLAPIPADDAPDSEFRPVSGPGRKDTPGSTPFVPAAAGLMIASQIVRELTADCIRKTTSGK